MSETATAVTPDLHEETNALVIDAKAIRITSPQEMALAAQFLLGVKDLERKVLDTFAPLKKKAFETHKAICNAEAEQLEPVKDAEQIVKRAMKAYQAERQRIEEEEAKQRLATQRALDEERRLQQAMDLEEQGDEAAALEVLDAPPRPILVPVPPPLAKVTGITSRTTYSARITDPLALLQHIVAHPDFINLVTFNVAALNGLARNLKGALKLPGVEVITDTNIAAGRR
jgi:hypothetical protein